MISTKHILALIVTLASTSYSYADKQAMVNSPGDGFLALRSDPSSKEGSRITKIPHNATIVIEDCLDGKSVKDSWCRATYEGKSGWVFSKYIKILSSDDSEARVASTADVPASPVPSTSQVTTATAPQAAAPAAVETAESSGPNSAEVPTSQGTTATALSVEQKASLTSAADLHKTRKDGNGKDIVTIYTDGYGKDVPLAAQNAAKNALSQAVGSYIDSTQAMSKKVNIENGIRDISKCISTDIKEYSQGSISNFKIVSVSNNGGMTNVSAKVDVKIDDFRHYVETLAKDEIAVQGASLFAEAAENKRQSDHKASILYENIINPVVNGKVEKISISKPVSAKSQLDTFSKDPLRKIPSYVYQPYVYELEQLDVELGSDKSDIFAFHVDMTAEEAYLLSVRKVLDEIASEKKTLRGCNTERRQITPDLTRLVQLSAKTDGVIVSILGGSMKSCETTELSIYLIEGVSSKIRGLAGFSGGQGGRVVVNKDLVFTFKDNNGSELSSSFINNKRVDYNGDGFSLSFPGLGSYFRNVCGYLIEDRVIYSWTLADLNLSRTDMTFLTIVPSRKFYVFSKIDMDSLAKATSVEAKFNN